MTSTTGSRGGKWGAPTLLEALKEAVAALYDFGPEDKIGPVVERCEIAIAKAEMEAKDA